MDVDKLGQWMRREILEQPQVVTRVLERESDTARRLGGMLRAKEIRFAVLAARGTSDHAAMLGKYILEWGLGVPAALAAPSIATLYKRDLHLKHTAVLGISQSGSSPDVVEYVARASACGAVTIAITNDPRSSLAQAAHHRLWCHAGTERSVAATKTFTAELACLYLLTSHWAQGDRGQELLQGVRRCPELLRQALKMESSIRAQMLRWRNMERCVVLGRGFSYPVALETALKLKETSGVFAEGGSAADFLHGPVAMARRQAGVKGLKAILLTARGPGRASLLRARKQLQGAGVQTLAWTPPTSPDWLAPFALAIMGQLAALHLSRYKKLNADRPAGLRKITKTR